MQDVSSAAADGGNERYFVVFAQWIVVFLVLLVDGDHQARGIAHKRRVQAQQLLSCVRHLCAIGQADFDVRSACLLLVPGEELDVDYQRAASRVIELF